MATVTRTVDQLEGRLGELLEAREVTKKEARRFERYRDRPVDFIREVLREEPWDKQEEIALAVRDHPLVTVRSCQSVGKDWLGARLALWWYATRPLSKVLVTGPTERQVKEIVFGEIRRSFQGSDVPGELYTTALRGPSERLILGFTSTDVARLTGLHAPGGTLVVMTEGQGLEPFAYESMHRCATGENDRFLVVGNPLSPTGEFYRIHRPSSAWLKFKIRADDHPNVREGREVIPGAITKRFVETIEREYGKNSPQYVSGVLAEFPSSSEFGLVDLAWIEQAIERGREQVITYPNGRQVQL